MLVVEKATIPVPVPLQWAVKPLVNYDSMSKKALGWGFAVLISSLEAVEVEVEVERLSEEKVG
jgi:hypothetical protein